MIVSLSGVDCAGKTTQLDRLVAYLDRRGRRPTSMWYRPGYSAELDALRAAVRKLRPGTMPHVDSDRSGHQKAFANPRVRRTWLAMAMADSLMHYAVKLRALDLAGRTVVCDRYLDDAMMDMAFRFPELERWSQGALGTIARISPRPRPAFLITLPYDEMLRRMAEKNEPFPDPPEIRDRRYAMYQDLARSGRYEVIDGTRSRDAIQAQIVEAVEHAEGR